MRSSLDTSGMQATRLSTSFATSAVGCSSARPFSAYSRSAASSLRASATNPYTVSNGRTTGRPAWTAATASATVLSSPPFDHPLDAGEVARDLRLGVTVFAQCLFDLSRLAVADSDVEDARPRLVRDQRARALDHDLGLGTRHEGAPVRVQRQPPESPLAQHVGQRFTLFPPPGQAFELVLVDVAVLVDARPGNAEDVRDE